MVNRYDPSLMSPPPARGLVQYDERGRPYMMTQGRRSYISPMGMGAPRPEDTQRATFLRQRPRWNQHTGEWETPINWGNVLSLGAGAGIGAGALSATGAFGGVGGGTPSALGPVATSGGTTEFTVPPSLAVVPPAITGGRHVASWLLPGLEIGGNLGGAYLQSRAVSEGEKLRARSTQEALDFEKQQYADLLRRLEPYRASGESANDRMASLLGLPARPIAPPSGTIPPARPGQPAASMATRAAQPTLGMVLMKAPDGTTKAVPPETVAHYQQHGAVVVQGGA